MKDGRDELVDTEAVRSLAGGVIGLAARLTRAWQRYRTTTPLALTEAAGRAPSGV